MRRRLAAILSIDVVGYTRLMAIDEAGTLARVRRHRTGLIEPRAERHNGRIIKLLGDGALLEFASVVDAVSFAVDVQMAMAESNAASDASDRLLYRIGINIGDIVVEDDDIFGDGVNVASRIEGLASPGGIAIARNVQDQIQGKLDLGTTFLGEREVKNVPAPVAVYEIDLDGRAAKLVAGFGSGGHDFDDEPAGESVGDFKPVHDDWEDAGEASPERRWFVPAISGLVLLIAGGATVLLWPSTDPPAETKPVDAAAPSRKPPVPETAAEAPSAETSVAEAPDAAPATPAATDTAQEIADASPGDPVSSDDAAPATVDGDATADATATEADPAAEEGAGAESDPAAAPAGPDQTAVLVLPFSDLEGDGEFSHLANGMTDDMIVTLSGLPGLRVIARDDSLRFAGQEIAPRDAAEATNAAYVLRSGVARDGDTIRIRGELFDGATGTALWPEALELTGSDVSDLQTVLADRLAEAIGDALTSAAPGPASGDMPASGEVAETPDNGAADGTGDGPATIPLPQSGEDLALAPAGETPVPTVDAADAAEPVPPGSVVAEEYDHYARGLALFLKTEKAANAEALAVWEGGLEDYPQSGLLTIMTGWAHHMMGRFGWGEDRVAELQEAARLAEEGLADPALPPAGRRRGLWLRATSNLVLHRDFDATVRAATAAVEAFPADTETLFQMGDLAIQSGATALADEWISRALSRDPSPAAADFAIVGQLRYVQGRYEEAVSMLGDLPSYPATDLAVLAAAYSRLGRQEHATRTVARFRETYSWLTPEILRSSWPWRDPEVPDGVIAELAKLGWPG